MSALGTHLLVSLFFVIGTVIEFAIVLCIKKRMDTRGSRVSSRGPLVDKKLYLSKCLKLESKEQLNKDDTHTHKLKYYSTTEKIDLTALFLFMVLYVMFNTVYFSQYM